MKKILLLALLAIALLSCNRIPDEGVVKGKTIVTERVLPYKVFGFSWVDYRPTEYYLRLVDQDDKVYFIEVLNGDGILCTLETQYVRNSSNRFGYIDYL